MKTILQTLFFFFLVTQICFAQWVQTNGPYGGYVTALAASGSNLFAGTGGFTADGGVYRSVNNGASWTEITEGLTAKWINTLDVYHSDTGDTIVFAGNMGGVFRSTNNGDNWTEVNSGLPENKWVTSFAFNDDILFTGLYYGGVYLSIDDGISWTEAGLSEKNVTALIVTPDGVNLFAGTGGSIFRSTDNGTSWSEVNSNLSVGSFAVIGTNVYAGTANGIYLSTDNGISWTEAGLTGTTINTLVDSGTNLFAGSWSGGVFLSTDNGTSWSSLGLTNKDIRALVVSSNGNGVTSLFAGIAWGGGVFRWTNNNAIWTEANNGLTHVNVLSLAISSDGKSGRNIFAGTLLNGIFLSTNNGISWSTINNGLTYTSGFHAVTSFASIGTVIFASTSHGVFSTTNNGVNWIASNFPKEIYVNALATSGMYLYAGTYEGIYLSTDNGISWILVDPNLSVSSFAVIGTNIYAGAANGIYLSTDNGISWISRGLTGKIIGALGLITNKKGDTNLYAGTDEEGVFLSTDGGINWVSKNEGLPINQYGHYYSVTSFAVNGLNLFAGTSGGVFLSIYSGASWAEVDTGLTHNNSVSSLLISSEETGSPSLFAGTGGSVWRRPLSEMITNVENTIELPMNFALYQNYPNPFNPSTKISWQLPEGSNVTLTIFNTIGEEIVILVNNEYQNAGEHSSLFIVNSTLPSGVYFYQLKAGSPSTGSGQGFVETKKMILLK